MLTDVESRLQALLDKTQQLATQAPKKEGQIASHSPEPDFSFETALKTLLRDIFSAYDATALSNKGPSVSKFYRAWTLACHPDKPFKGFTFSNIRILSQELTIKLNNQLCTAIAGNCQSHDGHLFIVLQAAYRAFEGKKVTKKGEDSWVAFQTTVSMENIWETIAAEIESQNLASHSSEKSGLIPIDSLVLMKFSSTDYFVGSLKKWLEAELSHRLYQVLSLEIDKIAAIKQLWENFCHSKMYELLASFDQHTLFEAAINNIYKHATELSAPTHPDVVPSNVAMIKYQLLLLSTELSRPEYIQPSPEHKVKIHPLGFSSAVAYETQNPQEYFHFITSLALLQALLVEPAYFTNGEQTLNLLKEHISSQDKTYFNQQYDFLCKLLTRNSASDYLRKLNLPSDLLTSINAKLGQKKSNSLLELTHWFFAHDGIEAVSPPPELWQAFKQTLGSDDLAGEGNIFAEIDNLPERKKLNRLPYFLENGLFLLPLLLWNALSLYFFSGFNLFVSLVVLNAECIIGSSKEGLLPPLIYFQAESLLYRIALISTCEKIPHPHPNWSPALDNFYRQVLPLLKRILLNPVDPYHPRVEQLLLQLTYPLRAVSGLCLAAICVGSILAKGLIQQIIKMTSIAIFSVANVSYDTLCALRKNPWTFRSTWYFFSSCVTGFSRSLGKNLPNIPFNPQSKETQDIKHPSMQLLLYYRSTQQKKSMPKDCKKTEPQAEFSHTQKAKVSSSDCKAGT